MCSVESLSCLTVKSLIGGCDSRLTTAVKYCVTSQCKESLRIISKNRYIPFTEHVQSLTEVHLMAHGEVARILSVNSVGEVFATHCRTLASAPTKAIYGNCMYCTAHYCQKSCQQTIFHGTKFCWLPYYVNSHSLIINHKWIYSDLQDTVVSF